MLSPLRPAHRLTWACRPNRKHSETNCILCLMREGGWRQCRGVSRWEQCLLGWEVEVKSGVRAELHLSRAPHPSPREQPGVGLRFRTRAPGDHSCAGPGLPGHNPDRGPCHSGSMQSLRRRSVLPPLPPLGSQGCGTLTDHDARERQDEGGHEGRGHDGEDEREGQAGLWGGRHWKTVPTRQG